MLYWMDDIGDEIFIVLANREEKLLCHVAMVAKFLDENKPKTSLKKWICTVSNFIDLVQFRLICQMLGKFSWVKSERTASKFSVSSSMPLVLASNGGCVHVLL